LFEYINYILDLNYDIVLLLNINKYHQWYHTNNPNQMGSIMVVFLFFFFYLNILNLLTSESFGLKVILVYYVQLFPLLTMSRRLVEGGGKDVHWHEI